MRLYLGGLNIGRTFESEILRGGFSEGLILFIYLFTFFFGGGGAYYRNFREPENLHVFSCVLDCLTLHTNMGS